jgi:hypothetical protein
MPKTKRYREARARQQQSGDLYTVALGSPPGGGGDGGAGGSNEGRHLQPECPRCRRATLDLGGKKPRCPRCRYARPAPEMVDEYLDEVVGLSKYSTVKDGGEWPSYQCPSCRDEHVLVALEPGDEVANPRRFICFGCGEAWADGELNVCCECNEFRELGEAIICDDCFDEKVAKDD